MTFDQWPLPYVLRHLVDDEWRFGGACHTEQIATDYIAKQDDPENWKVEKK
jgi:hypothetical protein